MKLNKESFLQAISPVMDHLGYYYLKNLIETPPIFLGKRVSKESYLFLIIGREGFEKDHISIEMSLSFSTNPLLTGKDIPANNILRVDVIPVEKGELLIEKETDNSIWSLDKFSKTSDFYNSVTIAESCLLRDIAIKEALTRSKKMKMEVQMEEWVIDWYYNKDEAQLPLKEFLQYVPKEPVEDIPIKWFIVSEIIIKITWINCNKQQVFALAIQSYWKDYLDSQPMFYPENKDL